jgi:hypothetical protein
MHCDSFFIMFGNCSGLQSSARGIAIIGGPCPRSLQLGGGVRRKIIATEPILSANGIAIIGIGPTLSATEAGPLGGQVCAGWGS